MEVFIEICFIIGSYLLGSIPWALIISKIVAHVDIRNYGSKNMGATNTLRVLGLGSAITCFFLDALKGAIPVALFSLGILSRSLIPHIHPIILGLVALIGHVFPIYVGFKGGKGVACMTGILLAYCPWCFLIEITVFILILIFTKYVSAASITSLFTAFLLSFTVSPIGHDGPDPVFTIFCAIAFLFIIILHLPNLRRLIKGEEPQVHRAILKTKPTDMEQQEKQDK